MHNQHNLIYLQHKILVCWAGMYSQELGQITNLRAPTKVLLWIQEDEYVLVWVCNTNKYIGQPYIESYFKFYVLMGVFSGWTFIILSSLQLHNCEPESEWLDNNMRYASW